MSILPTTKKTVLLIVGLLLVIFLILSSQRNQKNEFPLMTEDIEEFAGDFFADESVESAAPDVSAAVVQQKNMIAPPQEGLVAQPPLRNDVFEPDVEKKVIRSGTIDMKVNAGSTDRVLKNITHIAQSFGGDILSTNFSKDTRNLNAGFVVVKVAEENFAQAFDEIKNVGSIVLHESVSAQDVSAEFIDQEAYLKNKRAEEGQFQRLFERAQDVDDVLKVTRELTRVRSEIDRIEGRLKYLRNQTQFSTITVHLSEDTKILASQSWRPWQDLKDATRTLIERSQHLISGTIHFVVAKIPFIILAVFVIFVSYKIIKKILKRYSS